MTDFEILPGGNIIAVGNANGGFCIVKHNSAGDTILTKTIPGTNYSSSLAKIKWETGSTLIVLGGNGQDIYRIDTLCNILYTKHLSDHIKNSVFCYDLQCLPNGDKLLLYSADISPQFVARFTGDFGAIKWSRLVTGNNYSSQVIYRNMLIDGQKLFLTGGGSENYAFNFYGAVTQLDILTGKLVKSKRFKIDFSSNDADGLFLDKMIKYNDGYIAKSTFARSDDIPVEDILGYTRFDTDLNIITVQSFKNINNTVAQSISSFDLYAKPDGSIFGAHGSSNYNMFRINGNDSLLWTHRVDPWLGYVLKLKETADGFIGFGISNYTAVGVGNFGYYYLLKSTTNGELPGCQSYADELTLKTLPFSYKTDITTIVDSTNFNIEDIVASPLSQKFDVSIGCNTVGLCTSVEIIGDTTDCSTVPAIFTGRRNFGCSIPVSFNVTPANDVSIQSVTDSTSSISFLKDGMYLIRALLQTPCGTFYDSMLVTVKKSAPLQLGPDTLLCNNTSIVLKGPVGNLSYLWNTGSTDSILYVENSGSYSLKVTDFCNHVYNDTIEVKPAPVFVFTAGDDQSICNGDGGTLSATAGFLNYHWFPDYKISTTNGGTVRISPNVDTFYIVTAEKWSGCVVKDTVAITVKPIPLINLGNDTSFCYGDSVTLNAPLGYSEYAWSTGNNTKSIIVKNAGKYSIIAKAVNNCFTTDTLTVKSIYALPIVNLGNDVNICSGNKKILDAGNFSSYTWQDGSTNRYFTVKDKGIYKVTVTDIHSCNTIDSINIKSIQPVPVNFLADIDTLCKYDEVQLKTSKIFVNYSWSNGSSEQSIVVKQPGMYILNVLDVNGCTGSDTIQIVEKDCMNGVFIPSAFTPNNDGTNDHFTAKVFGRIVSFQLTIYNKFGQVVFTTKDPFSGWDGTQNGINIDTGAFVYTCSYQLEGSAFTFKKGTCLLIR